jgi:hypothetical protein
MLGSTGCQPVVNARQELHVRTLDELFGKLPTTIGQRPVLPRSEALHPLATFAICGALNYYL